MKSSRSRFAPEFLMLCPDALDRMSDLFKSKALRSSDFVTFVALIRFTSWRSARAEVTSRELGEFIGAEPSNVRSSLVRLKKARLVAYMREGTTCFYSLNPTLVRASRSDSRARMVDRWKQEGLL